MFADRSWGRRPREVQAAGGVVVRDAAGELEVLLVHRPRYDDWSFPKGKAEPRESPVETARREVWEETGFACTVGSEVAVTRYVDRRGRPKVVRYFLMRIEHGSFVANDEVDAIAWCDRVTAIERLTYPRDHDVLVAARAVAW